jgi:hypothetical protein
MLGMNVANTQRFVFGSCLNCPRTRCANLFSNDTVLGVIE